jgi:hypothetical protein
MKLRLCLSLLTTITVLPVATAASPQDSVPAPPLTPPPVQLEDFPGDIGHQLHQGLAQARHQLEQQLAALRRSTSDAARTALAGARLDAARLQGALGIPGAMDRRTSQALLIRTRELDPEAQKELEEDLQVMARIVEKATEARSNRAPRAMGIDLVFGSSPVRSLYLDGYGALFLATVNHPLLPVPTREKEAPEEPGSEIQSTWEQTRQELFGLPHPPVPPEPMLGLRFAWGDEQGEEQAYDAAKVEVLHQELLAAIKNASNIRHLTADDSVTICVMGSAVTGPAKVRILRALPEGEARQEDVVVRRRGSTAVSSRSVMTLHARKADIDRYAAGDTTLEEFRELSRTQLYSGSGGWTSSNPFFWSQD